jgi:ABC-2 type transport system permease protein
MRTIRVAVIGGFLSYRALFHWVRPASFIGSLIVAPLLQLLFFVYLGRATGVANDEFFVLGSVMLAATGACIFGGTMAITNERAYGTLGHVLLSTCSRTALWAGRAVPYALNALLVMLFTLGCATILLGVRLPAGSLAGLAAAMAAGSISCTAFGFTIGAAGLRLRSASTIANAAMLILILCSGAEVPRAALPLWISGIGSYLPLTHAISAARASAGGLGGSAVMADVGRELLVGAGYVCLAAALLKFFERHSRSGPSLDAV